LKNDFGHVLIKAETLLDKIHELINPIEVKFPNDPEFNKRFYVVTDNIEKVKSNFTKQFMAYLSKNLNEDFLIEILGNKLIIGNRKIIEAKTAIGFVDFMDQLSKI
jgi:hypothetical protein